MKSLAQLWSELIETKENAFQKCFHWDQRWKPVHQLKKQISVLHTGPPCLHSPSKLALPSTHQFNGSCSWGLILMQCHMVKNLFFKSPLVKNVIFSKDILKTNTFKNHQSSLGSKYHADGWTCLKLWRHWISCFCVDLKDKSLAREWIFSIISANAYDFCGVDLNGAVARNWVFQFLGVGWIRGDNVKTGQNLFWALLTADDVKNVIDKNCGSKSPFFG